MGVLQISRDSYFLEETLGAQHCGQLGVQNLDRDFAIMLLVVREIDGGHPTTAQFALDCISGERTLHLFKTFSHFVGARQPRGTTDSSRTLQSSGLASTGRQARNVHPISRMVNCFRRLRDEKENPASAKTLAG